MSEVRWLRVSEAAERLFVSPRSIRLWVESHDLEAMPVNPFSRRGALLISVASIERFEAAREEKRERVDASDVPRFTV